MILMTEGLRAAAGGALRDLLARFTSGRLSAIGSGALITALVQSSSATTLTTIGFVSAGFLTFPQALGVIVGANLGTTSTGWIVALLGLKLNVTVVAFPLVGVGALLRLLRKGKTANLGMALAGFGLIFVGIDALQAGMVGLADELDPSRFPATRVGGRLLLVGVGVVMTVIMQSSSAAVATTLTALHSGAIDLPQAAVLVIGQNVGTTVTAALASIGASVPARRTALAHILFNAAAGAMAFVGLPLFLMPIEWMAQGPAAGDPALLIAAFHTLFNGVAALLLFPVMGPFARGVMHLIPDRRGAGLDYLDHSVAGVPAVALAAAHRGVSDVMDGAFQDLFRLLSPPPSGPGARRWIPGRGGGGTGVLGRDDPSLRGAEALDQIRSFLARVQTSQDFPEEYRKHIHLLHAMDHLQRLEEALLEGEVLLAGGGGVPAAASEPLARAILRLLPLPRLPQEEGGMPELPGEAAVPDLETVSRSMAQLRLEHRAGILSDTARGRLTPEEARREIEALLWLDRVAYHAWRGYHHLTSPKGEDTPRSAPTELREV